MSPAMTSDRTTTMERFGNRGMALLPWTKQMLTVLWGQLWIMVRVIYCTFLSVFQMFRFEVHFRITDEMGQHNPTESFLFSSLFDGDAGMMVGHPSDLCADDGGGGKAETLLSGLAPDDSVYMGFHGDWNIFSAFPKEVGDAGKFDSQESQAMWESVSTTCNDHYDLFVKKSKADMTGGKVTEEMSGLKMWVSRSDSDSSWSSWSSSDVSVADLEENERLLEFFSNSDDPYNPMCFTACAVSKAPLPVSAGTDSGEGGLVSSSEDEDELWRSLGRKDDPYHPLNFQARLNHQQPQHVPEPVKNTPAKHATLRKRCRRDTQRADRVIRVPWKRPARKCQTPDTRRPETPKKREVRFSPVVEVHVMRAWRFAAAASRKGPWEEMARDRERFRRRVGELERVVGYCLEPAHRGKMRVYVETHTNQG
ncbi:uncharacterized protein ACBT44_010803 [Syngnathus typhle]